MNSFLQTLKKPLVIIILVAIGVGSLLFSIAAWKYTHHEYNALDVAIFNNVFQRTIAGDLFGSSIHPPTYLADHISPIIVGIAPVYALFPHPLTLIVLQILALLSSAIPLYFVAKKYLTESWSLGIALLWIFNPIVHNIAMFEFHILPFAVWALLWAAYGYVYNRYWFFVGALGLALVIREDVALVVAVFGIIALIDKKPWQYSVMPLVGSVIYFCGTMYVSSLFSAGGYKFLIYYSWLGNSWGEIMFTALTNPWLVLSRLVSPGSALLAAALLLPWCFIPLVRTKWLFLGSLIFVQLVTGTAWQNLGVVLYTQYANLLMPGIALAAIESVAVLLVLKKKNAFQKLILEPRALALVLLTATVYTTFTLGPLPGSLQAMTAQNVEQNLGLTEIPSNSFVCASDRFLAELSSRPDICALTYAWVGVQQFGEASYTIPETTEYVVLDTNDLITYQLQYQHHPLYAVAYASSSAQWASLLAPFGVISAHDTTIVLKRGATNTVTLVDETPAPVQTPTSITDELTFIHADAKDGGLETWWQINKPLPQLYRLKMTLLAGDNLIDEHLYPLGYDLLSGRTGVVHMTYYPSFFKKSTPNTTAVRLQLITIEKGGVELTPWRSSRQVIDTQTEVGQPITIPITQ